MSSYDAATVLGINVKTFNRITACLLVTVNSNRDQRKPDTMLNESEKIVNIGLQFKNLKNKTQLSGYAKYVDGHWKYSTAAIDLAEEYCRLFPEILKCVNQIDRRYKIYETEIYPDYRCSRLEEVLMWLQSKGHLKSEIVKCGAELLQKEAIDSILDAIEQLKVCPANFYCSNSSFLYFNCNLIADIACEDC